MGAPRAVTFTALALLVTSTAGCDGVVRRLQARRDAGANDASTPTAMTKDGGDNVGASTDERGSRPTATAVPIDTTPRALAHPPSAQPAVNPGGPRLGKYTMLSFGAGSVPIYLGRIDLSAGGHYGVSNTSTGPYYGEGTYTFDVTNARVVWLTGPLHDQGWQGAFTVERGGKTHKIRVRPTTVATNSTDS